jgi:hypothetical protein
LSFDHVEIPLSVSRLAMVSNSFKSMTHAPVLLGCQMVPMLDQHQVLLDFEFDKSQCGLKLFLARELEACFVVLGVAVGRGRRPYKFPDEVDLGRSGFIRLHGSYLLIADYHSLA